MAQLIQMRQRIKAIEIIKKITHAMQLISMSMHSRLRSKAPLIKNYQEEIALLFQKVQFAAPDWKNPILHPEASPESNQLIILIASQKGLCGNFNSALFKNFQKTFPSEKRKKASIIAVGKHAVTYLERQKVKSVIKTFDNLSSAQLNIISGRIINLIHQAKIPYSSVIILSNTPKTFYIQEPQITYLLPFNEQSIENRRTNMPKEPYTWEQNPSDILNDLALQYLTSKLYHLLFDSILAEQAARFISMDNSTRNAKQLLEETQLQYNKLRQAKITRELTELSASF